MGHPELEYATFLTEWDYEPPEVGEPVKNAFLSTIRRADETLMSYYGAHKHLAKAFKASKHANRQVAEYKTHRNLERAQRIVAGGRP